MYFDDSFYLLAVIMRLLLPTMTTWQQPVRYNPEMTEIQGRNLRRKMPFMEETYNAGSTI